MAEPKTGASCKLFYNTGTNASPVWVEVDPIDDLTQSDRSVNVVEVPTRASRYPMGLAGMRGLPKLSFGVLHGVNNTVQDQIRGDHDAEPPTVRQYWAADGASGTTGTEGLAFYGLVGVFNQNQPLEDGVKFDVEIHHAWFLESSARVLPTWKEVT